MISDNISTLLLSLLASGAIKKNNIPFVDVSIANAMNTYVLRCLQNSSSDAILDLFSIEGKQSWILLNNHGFPFPFARFNSNVSKEAFRQEMEIKAQRDVTFPEEPLEENALYVVNKSGALVMVKQFRLRSYLVGNHFLKLDNDTIVDLYLNRQQAEIALKKGLSIAPVSEAQAWTIYIEKNKLVKEYIDQNQYPTELIDTEKYIIVGKKFNIQSFTTTDIDDSFSLLKTVPLFQSHKKCSDKLIDVESLFYSQKGNCVTITFPSEFSKTPLLFESGEQLTNVQSEVGTIIKQLINCRWTTFTRKEEGIILTFSLFTFQKTLEVLKKKIGEALLLPNSYSNDSRRVTRGLISTTQTALNLIEHTINARYWLGIDEVRMEFVYDGKASLEMLLERLHDFYQYFVCFVCIDGESSALPLMDIKFKVEGEYLHLYTVTTELSKKESVFVAEAISIAKFSPQKKMNLFTALLNEKIACITINKGELVSFQTWNEIARSIAIPDKLSLEEKCSYMLYAISIRLGIAEQNLISLVIPNQRLSLFQTQWIKKKAMTLNLKKI